MKVKKVNQYKCDFCGKKNYSASAMIKHEKHCTMNPDRHCRMCDLLSGAQHDLNHLKTLVPDPDYKYIEDDCIHSLKNEEEVNKGVEKVIEETEGCPLCSMAVLRQKKICIPMTTFDYKKVNAEAWEKINENSKEWYSVDF